MYDLGLWELSDPDTQNIIIYMYDENSSENP